MKNLDELNSQIRACRRCRLSETRINALCGEGNSSARIMLVAQAPGETEDREGVMFIGPSGRVLDELLSNAGIGRSEIYITNLIKCMLPKYRKPKQDEIETCSQYLNREIELIQPEVIVPLGYYSTKYILGKYEVNLPKTRADFSEVYGKLFFSKNKKIYPLRHPASLLYNDDIRGVMMNNYSKLRVLKTDCKWFPTCPMKRYWEVGALDRKWIELYCRGDWDSCVRYHMEERGEYHPDWMLPDGSIDEGLMDGLEKR